MSEPIDVSEKGRRRSACYYIIMNDGQVHFCKGLVKLKRTLNKLDQGAVKMILRGHAITIEIETVKKIKFV